MHIKRQFWWSWLNSVSLGELDPTFVWLAIFSPVRTDREAETLLILCFHIDIILYSWYSKNYRCCKPRWYKTCEMSKVAVLLSCWSLEEQGVIKEKSSNLNKKTLLIVKLMVVRKEQLQFIFSLSQATLHQRQWFPYLHIYNMFTGFSIKMKPKSFGVIFTKFIVCYWTLYYSYSKSSRRNWGPYCLCQNLWDLEKKLNTWL